MMDAQSEPLKGITVIDLTRVLAGPFCTMILAQLGARVIKVECPPHGDDSRAFGPFVQGKSVYFSSLNYDKESISLNLKDPADRAIFEDLIDMADVLVENYRPGVMDKLGYGWDFLHKKNPGLIYGAASGFGHNGPYAKRAAYDVVVQAMSGIMSITGYPDSPPTRVGVSIGDLCVGMYLALGVVAALRKRDMGGGGSMVDVAMLDCQLSLLGPAISAYFATGNNPGPHGSRHPEIAPFQAFHSQDGFVVIAAGNDHLFELLAKAIDRPELLANANYRTNDDRLHHVEALEVDLEKTLRTKPTAHWLEVLEKAGVPCGPVNTVAQAMTEPQVAARNMLVSIPDPVLDPLKVAGNPIKFSGVSERELHKGPPDIDAHRQSVLDMIARHKKASAPHAG